MRRPTIESAPTTAALPAYCPAPPRARQARATQPIATPRKPRGRRNARGQIMLTVAQLFDSSANAGRGRTLPMIRLRGRWLQRLGFKTGERIAVTQERG